MRVHFRMLPDSRDILFFLENHTSDGDEQGNDSAGAKKQGEKASAPMGPP